MMGEKIEALLLDLNGTLHVEDSAIPGSQDALKRLQASGIKVKYVTNTTEMSMRKLTERLQALGFDIEKDEIFSALTASVKLIQDRDLRPYLIVDMEALEEFNDIDQNDPNAVVIGLAPEVFNYKQMDKAFRLMMAGAPLIAMLMPRYYPRKDGVNHLGPGMFVKGLEYATDAKAEVVGKPSAEFFLAALNGMDVNPENTLMVGDDVRDDVEGAMKAGMQGALVKTGKYRPGDENKISTPPSYVFEDFPAVVDFVLSDQSSLNV